jgi:hypothetical protein
LLERDSTRLGVVLSFQVQAQLLEQMEELVLRNLGVNVELGETADFCNYGLEADLILQRRLDKV